VSGVRALGGIVLAAAAVWCFVRWRERAGTGRAVALVVFYAVAFVVSHVIAGALGTWGAVFTVAAAVAGASWLVADRSAIRR
jgi:formate/nitrite transporter FocA (FNT family)